MEQLNLTQRIDAPMLIPRVVLEFVAAEPFRAFRMHMASGRVFDVNHPEMVKIGKSSITVHAPPDGDSTAPDRWQEVSLMQLESVEPISVKSSNGKRKRKSQ
jgi:hypothetical protein